MNQRLNTIYDGLYRGFRISVISKQLAHYSLSLKYLPFPYNVLFFFKKCPVFVCFVFR